MYFETIQGDPSRLSEDNDLSFISWCKDLSTLISFLRKGRFATPAKGSAIFKKIVYLGDANVMKTLIDEFKFDPSTENNIAINSAIKTCNLDMIRVLIEDPRVSLPSNSLIHACENGKLDVVKLLIDHPSIEIAYNKNMPLSLACTNGHIDIVKELLAHYPLVDPSCQNNYPILISVRNQYYDLVELLLSYKEVSPYYGLWTAASRGDLKMVKLLVGSSNYDAIDIEAYDAATAHGFTEILDEMEPKQKKIKSTKK